MRATVVSGFLSVLNLLGLLCFCQAIHLPFYLLVLFSFWKGWRMLLQTVSKKILRNTCDSESQYHDEHGLLTFAAILGICYLSLVLSQICDSYLVEALELLQHNLSLDEDVAGVTILALGGSLPELAVNSFATLEGTEIGIGTIIGSAILNLTVGVVVLALLSPTAEPIASAPLYRDIVFYVAALGMVWYFRRGNRVTLTEALMMVSLYIVFVVYLWIVQPTYTEAADPKEAYSNVPQEEGKFVNKTQGLGLGLEKSDDESDADADATAFVEDSEVRVRPPKSTVQDPLETSAQTRTSSALGRFSRPLIRGVDMLVWLVCTPTRVLFYWTVPDVALEEKRSLYLLTLVISMLYVFLLSFLVMSLAQWLSCLLKLDESFGGLVFLAFATSVPDLIAMGITAYRGLGAMAMGGLVGSNIFDVLMGLGLPWLLRIASDGAVVLKDAEVAIGVVFCILAVLGLVTSMWLSSRPFSLHHFSLCRRLAVLPALIYLSYLLWESADELVLVYIGLAGIVQSVGVQEGQDRPTERVAPNCLGEAFSSSVSGLVLLSEAAVSATDSLKSAQLTRANSLSTSASSSSDVARPMTDPSSSSASSSSRVDRQKTAPSSTSASSFSNVSPQKKAPSSTTSASSFSKVALQKKAASSTTSTSAPDNWSQEKRADILSQPWLCDQKTLLVSMLTKYPFLDKKI
eukprot:g53950.t1